MFEYLGVGKLGNPSALDAEDRWFKSSRLDQNLMRQLVNQLERVLQSPYGVLEPVKWWILAKRYEGCFRAAKEIDRWTMMK